MRLLAGAGCVLAVASCDTPLEPTVDGVDRIVVTPTTSSLEAGATVTLTALVLDAEGNAMRERKVVWASENTAVASVSQSGVVTGVAAGIVQVAASSGGKSASATITVTPRPVSLVRVTPGSATISVAGSLTLQAEALDASGAPVIGRPVTWTSSNEAVAIVSVNGVVAGISAGSVTIVATIDGRSGSAVITVAPQPVASVVITPSTDSAVVGARVTFRATALDAQSLPLTGRSIVWTTSDPAIATVSSTGEAIGLAVGSARIRATVEDKFAEAILVVRPVPVSRVITTPNQIVLQPGQTSQLTVTLTDASGNILSGRSITYSSSAPAIATVSATGVITAVSEGSATIEAASEGKTATTIVTVSPVPVASIRINPTALSLGISQTGRLTAQALDAAGNPLSNRKFTWISGAPAVATVTQSGDVTAVAGGTAVIFAATEGISAS
ncbi:MAG: Ig-like domain-containing protein, partial [Gemmatimonadota bacterium]